MTETAQPERLGAPPSPAPGIRPALRRAAAVPVVLWSAFMLVHLVLGMLNLHAPEQPLGDVTGVYRYWSTLVLNNGPVAGIDMPFVYPVLALLPMLAAAAFGSEVYAGTWLSLVMLLNAGAFALLARRGPALAWWWLGFLLLLGPIALGRIDSVTVPIALAGALLAAEHPRVAAALLTLGAWVKVWPAALLAGLLVASRERVALLRTAVGFSTVVVLIALVLGSGMTVFSFVTQQTGRGLQVEAPVSTPWMWQAAAGAAQVYYDREILTFQVAGAGTALAAALATPLMALAVAGILLLGARAVHAGAAAGRITPPLLLALVTALIAFNKVGSPQFVAWLAVPVLVGLAGPRTAGSFRTPAVLVAAIAGLTQVIYPYLYDHVVLAAPAMVAVLTARNLLYVVLLTWAVLWLWKLGRRRATL